MLNSLVWFTTMACNFKCKYCWEVQAQERGDFKPEKFRKPQEWIDAWSRLRPQKMSITGGEPFLIPGFLDILESIANMGTIIGLTSNFSHPILDFVKRITPHQVPYITASYHPTEIGTKQFPMNADIFFGRMLLLKEFGFDPVVNIVTWPEQFWLIPEFRERCSKYGLRSHVDPYSSISYYPWTYTSRQKDELSKWVTPERDERGEMPPVLCSAGRTHLSVQPDGSAWRCILERQQMINPLGNIFDKDFSLLKLDLECHQASDCAGCDRDHVYIIPVPHT